MEPSRFKTVTRGSRSGWILETVATPSSVVSDMDDTLTLDPPIAPPVARPSRVRLALNFVGKVFRAIASMLEWLTGAVTLIVGLSALAALPVAQFLSLGYFLEAAGRVAKEGPDFRRMDRGPAGFEGRRDRSRVLPVAPARAVRLVADDVGRTDRPRRAGGPRVANWVALPVRDHFGSHRGQLRPGRLASFFPLATRKPPLAGQATERGGLYAESRDATWVFVEALHLPRYFRLGFLGFVGSMAWLGVPVTLLVLGRRAPLLGIVGALGLGVVATSLPFLQVRFAVEGRFAALFEMKAVRERFRRAPWAFALGFLLTVLPAVPLYLLKIERVPRGLDMAADPAFRHAAVPQPPGLRLGVCSGVSPG